MNRHLKHFVTDPTPPMPTSAAREARDELMMCISSSKVPRSTKSGSLGNGTVDKGPGVGSCGSIVRYMASVVPNKDICHTAYVRGARWISAVIDPELLPTWRPEFASPKIAEVIMVTRDTCTARSCRRWMDENWAQPHHQVTVASMSH